MNKENDNITGESSQAKMNDSTSVRVAIRYVRVHFVRSRV
jgi:hypothetical protein